MKIKAILTSKWFIFSSLALLLLLFLMILIPNWLVSSAAEGRVFDQVEEVPENKVGLLLGCARILPDGQQNLFYLYRIRAAVELYEAGKIEFILASGDNSRATYDEPSAMKADLMAEGIPEERIFLDYAGFSTLDSVLRAKEIFGQEELTIISQKFHNERALYIAKANGIKAVAYNAQDVLGTEGLKTRLREKLARTKMVVDLLFEVGPTYLGEKIVIE